MQLALLKSSAGPSKLGVGEVFSYVSSDVRRVITNATWAEIRTAYASGIGLREIARNMNIPEGTVLARAKREGWTRQIESSKALAKREDALLAVTPMEAVAMSMQQRGERHIERIAGVSERAVDHIETMDGPGILNTVDQIEKLDKVARRTFGLNDNPYSGFTLNVLNINSLQIDQDSPETR
jgi:transposase-like protein